MTTSIDMDTRVTRDEDGKPMFFEEELWWGPNNSMVIAAFLHCIEQKDFVSGICANWLQNNWHKLYPRTKQWIIDMTKDILAEGDVFDADKWKPIAEATVDTKFNHPWPSKE